MKRILYLSVFLAGLMLSAKAASAVDVNPAAITVWTYKDSVTADGIDYSDVYVRVKDYNGTAMGEANVKLVSSRGALEEMTPATAQTNGFGKATIKVRSLKDGKATIYAEVNGQRATQSVDITFKNGLTLQLKPGSLIKIPSDNDENTYADSAVYYYASNGKRYVFPNEKVYFTWYPTFTDVQILSLEDMTRIPIGGNVTYHPGSKPVKFQTDDKVYAVGANGELRWLKTENVARAIFGDNWAKQTDDISEAFYVNYKMGLPLDTSVDFMRDSISRASSTIDKDKGL